MRRLTSPLRNERGATLALVAVSILGLLSVLALAIDLGMLYRTKGEAHRAAEAGALAGASAFQDLQLEDPVAEAEARAVEWATKNHMAGARIVPPEVTVQVIEAERKVRVWVRNPAVPTWFARVFGVASVPVGAKAAAVAADAGTAKCVKPFLIPDPWEENTGDDALHPNQIWDFPEDIPNQPGTCGSEWECWSYDPANGDRYARFGEADATGLGSDFRDAQVQVSTGHRYKSDYARPVMLYPSFPQYSPTPSNWYLWRVECPGADCVRDAMTGCATPEIDVGDFLAAEQPGEARGAVQQGLEAWAAQDPSARFVESEVTDAEGNTHWTGEVVSDNPLMMGDANPRVFIAGLVSPDFLRPGYDEVPLNNLAKFYLESIPPNEGSKDPVQVRFLGFAQGFDEGPVEGTLVRYLRLVE